MMRAPLWAPPLLALQFLTCLPLGWVLDRLPPQQAKDGLARALIWFPLVGGLVGCATAIVLWAGLQVFSPLVAVVVALIAEARLTGAFHEDAVADFCDGFGGGTTPERIQEIMKDSRIGTYGALGLMLAVGLRAGLMLEIAPALLSIAIIASAALGRWMAVVAMAAIPPRPQGKGLVKDIATRPGFRAVALASILAAPFLAPLAWAEPLALLGSGGAALLFLLWFRRLLLRRLGGVTGDCLGFSVYVVQLLVLAGIAVWS